MTTPDLDARVRDAVLLMHPEHDREIAALLHDLQARIRTLEDELDVMHDEAAGEDL